MTARSARPAPSAHDAPRGLRRGRLRSRAVVWITDPGTMAWSVGLGAMMSRRVQSAHRDVAAAATQRLTAALAILTTNAQEA